MSQLGPTSSQELWEGMSDWDLPISSQQLWGGMLDGDMAAEEEAARQIESTRVPTPPGHQEPSKENHRQPERQPAQPPKRPSTPPNATASTSKTNQLASAPSPSPDADVSRAVPNASSSDDEADDPIRQLPADKGKARKGVQVRKKVTVSPDAPSPDPWRPACHRLLVAADGRRKTYLADLLLL